MAGVGTLWRTVRHLKARQLLGRVVFRLARQERDTWVTWPARVAALMAPEQGARYLEIVRPRVAGYDHAGAPNVRVKP
jgi:hypothetical protein